MSDLVLRVMRNVDDPDGSTSYWMWCPACNDAVRITDGWEWNGDLERPTFTPSILTTGVQWGEGDGFYKPAHAGVAKGDKIVCHSFLTDGIWNFLGDCTHNKAGQSVPMVPLPDWLAT